MTLVLAALAMMAGGSTTVLVENSSNQTVTLRASQMPDHYEPLSQTTLIPQASDRSVSFTGKLLIAHDRSDAEVLQLHYVDARGEGCIFTVAPVDHSTTWKMLKPRAEAIGDAVCKARTGLTSGDFVYVIR
jgi:hypothetical protein